MTNANGISTSKIARVWETKTGLFYLADWDNKLVTPNYFTSDSDVGEYAKQEGFQEIIWMELED